MMSVGVDKLSVDAAKLELNEVKRTKDSPRGTDSDYVCVFCNETNRDFSNAELRDKHYWNDCPMLVVCQHCDQVVEIAELTQHRLSACDHSHYVQCPRCEEAIETEMHAMHVNENTCPVAISEAVGCRCPLCHQDIGTGNASWKDHLMTEHGCSNNKRREAFVKKALKSKPEEPKKKPEGRDKTGKLESSKKGQLQRSSTTEVMPSHSQKGGRGTHKLPERKASSSSLNSTDKKTDSKAKKTGTGGKGHDKATKSTTDSKKTKAKSTPDKRRHSNGGK